MIRITLDHRMLNKFGNMTLSELINDKLVNSELVPCSQEEYLEAPSKCPFCGSTNLDAWAIIPEINTNEGYVTCADCEREWYDVYQLVGFRLVK